MVRCLVDRSGATLAPLPGVSRSGLTIAAALALGLSRTWSVGFSLLIAVPAIAGATVFELKDAYRLSLSADRVAQTVAATIVAGLVGYLAIGWLLRIVRSGKIWYFSVYLVCLAIVVLMLPEVRRDDRKKTNALDRPADGIPWERVFDRPDFEARSAGLWIVASEPARQGLRSAIARGGGRRRSSRAFGLGMTFAPPSAERGAGDSKTPRLLSEAGVRAALRFGRSPSRQEPARRTRRDRPNQRLSPPSSRADRAGKGSNSIILRSTNQPTRSSSTSIDGF